MRTSKLHLLTAFEVKALGPGRHSDGGGLYLTRGGDARSRWVFMWKRDGKRREMGLGREDPNGKTGLTLAQARAKAAAAREALAAGKDPIAARDERPPEPVVIPTFRRVAEDLIASLEAGWRNAKHAAQWSTTLGVQIVAGPSMSGKSFLALHLLAAICQGRDVFGLKTKKAAGIYFASRIRRAFASGWWGSGPRSARSAAASRSSVKPRSSTSRRVSKRCASWSRSSAPIWRRLGTASPLRL